MFFDYLSFIPSSAQETDVWEIYQKPDKQVSPNKRGDKLGTQ